jgi:hypothetical protein
MSQRPSFNETRSSGELQCHESGPLGSGRDRWKRAEFRKPPGILGRSEQHQYLAGGLLHSRGSHAPRGEDEKVVHRAKGGRRNVAELQGTPSQMLCKDKQQANKHKRKADAPDPQDLTAHEKVTQDSNIVKKESLAP